MGHAVDEHVGKRLKQLRTSRGLSQSVVAEALDHYLASLQERDYWYEKLRKANHPYETVAETLIKFKWTDFKMGGSTNLDRFI